MVRTPLFYCWGLGGEAWVQSLVRELRSPMPVRAQPKKKKKKKPTLNASDFLVVFLNSHEIQVYEVNTKMYFHIWKCSYILSMILGEFPNLDSEYSQRCS